MKFRSKRAEIYLLLALGMVGLSAIEPAHAQLAIGGGGGGMLAQVINWVVTNIVQGLILAAVLFVGALLIFGRHTLAGVAVVAIGAVVISQYQTIAGLFGIGG